MFAATMNRIALSIPFFGTRRATKAPKTGPLPTWFDDRQLSDQLFKDTGLSASDFGLSHRSTAPKNDFIKPNYW